MEERDLFHQVIALTGDSHAWETISTKIPQLPRSWFELSQLSSEDRIEFTRDFWFSRFSFLSSDSTLVVDRLVQFFNHLEDISIFMTQDTPNAPFQVHMLYTMRGERGFFHALPSAKREGIDHLQRQFENVHFPKDYLAFLEIHDGFSKYLDRGLIKTQEMVRHVRRFRELFFNELLISPEGNVIDPLHLVPFYESENLHSYQCFFTGWYAADEIGNVALISHEDEEEEHLMHHFIDDKKSHPSFLHWLLNYLETDES